MLGTRVRCGGKDITDITKGIRITEIEGKGVTTVTMTLSSCYGIEAGNILLVDINGNLFLDKRVKRVAFTDLCVSNSIMDNMVYTLEVADVCG